MNRILQTLLRILFSSKRKSGAAYPYRTLFVPDDVEIPPKDPWYGGLQKDLKSFSSRTKKHFGYVKIQIERLLPVMLKLVYLATFFGCVIGIGHLYDINSPTTIGLRWAAAICCAILGILVAIFFLSEMSESPARR